MNFVQQIQQIAIQAVRATQPMSFVVGTVVSVDPLKIQLDDTGSIIIEGEAIVLTSAVVERRVTVQKHTHKAGDAIGGHAHSAGSLPVPMAAATGGPVTGNTTKPLDEAMALPAGANGLTSSSEVVDTVIEAVCNEHGEDLAVESDENKIVFTINRALQNHDKIVMLSVDCGQTYIVLSRVFLEKGGAG